MLIKVRQHKVADFPYLFRLVLRSMYEPEKMSTLEEELMQSSFIHWKNKFSLSEDERWLLERMAWMIKNDMDGKYEERKRLFKDRGIDWRKFHRLPEGYILNPTPRKVLEKAFQRAKESANDQY